VRQADLEVGQLFVRLKSNPPKRSCSRITVSWDLAWLPFD
jgi:hypothetical protein